MKKLALIFVICILFQLNVNADQFFESDKISFSYPDDAEILKANEKENENIVYHLRCKNSTIMIVTSLSPRDEAMLKPMADGIFQSMPGLDTFKNAKIEQSELIKLKDKKGYKITTIVGNEPSYEYKSEIYVMSVGDKMMLFLTNTFSNKSTEECFKILESFKIK